MMEAINNIERLLIKSNKDNSKNEN